MRIPLQHRYGCFSFRKLMFSDENGIVELTFQVMSDNIVFVVVNTFSPS